MNSFNQFTLKLLVHSFQPKEVSFKRVINSRANFSSQLPGFVSQPENIPWQLKMDQPLFSTYKRYKAGTHKVTTWLATKARATKLLNDLFPKPPANTGKGRLKGKARPHKKGLARSTSSIWLIFLELLNRLQARR